MALPPQLQNVVGKLRAYPVALAALALSLLLGGAIFFRSASLDALETSLRETDSEWNRISGNLKRARDLSEHLERVRSTKETVDQRLMNPEERALNYEYFYSVERSAGVRLVNLNQGGVIDTRNSNIAGVREFKEYRLIGYNISLEGEFEAVVRFLSLLQNGKYLARISSFNVSRAQQAAAGTLVVNLQLQVLGLPQ
jgi:hypothetical protein